MSYEEKGTWVFLVSGVIAYATYIGIIFGRAGDGPLTEVSYVPVILWMIGVAVILSIVGHIAIAITKPSEADMKDVRDKEIHRFGEYAGGIVLGVGMLVPFGLAMAQLDYFWIVNAMYAVFVLASLTGTIVKLVAYRRGL